MVALTILTLGISYITVSAQEAEVPVQETVSLPISRLVSDRMASSSLDFAQASEQIYSDYQLSQITNRLDAIIRLLSK